MRMYVCMICIKLYSTHALLALLIKLSNSPRVSAPSPFLQSLSEPSLSRPDVHQSHSPYPTNKPSLPYNRHLPLRLMTLPRTKHPHHRNHMIRQRHVASKNRPELLPPQNRLRAQLKFMFPNTNNLFQASKPIQFKSRYVPKGKRSQGQKANFV